MARKESIMERQRIIEIVRAAQDELGFVRDEMIKLVPDVLTSADFDKINALERQLMDIEKANAPEYKPFKFSDLV